MSAALAIFMMVSPSLQLEGAAGQPQPTKLEIGRLNGEPLEWLGANVQICGTISEGTFGRYLSKTYGPDTVAVYISDKLVPDEAAKPETCYTGIWSRVDSKSKAQVRAMGYQSIPSHGINREYVLDAMASRR